MTQAAQDIAAIAAWVKASSPGKFRAPLGDDFVFPAPFASMIGVDPASTAYADLSGLADGGLVFFVPTGQLAAPFGAGRLERTTDGLPSPADRVAHLFGHRLGVDLPDVLTVALSSPAQSIMDVLTGEGLGDLDLDAVAVLAVPLWTIPADQRATVAGLCEYP